MKVLFLTFQVFEVWFGLWHAQWQARWEIFLGLSDNKPDAVQLRGIYSFILSWSETKCDCGRCRVEPRCSARLSKSTIHTFTFTAAHPKRFSNFSRDTAAACLTTNGYTHCYSFWILLRRSCWWKVSDSSSLSAVNENTRASLAFTVWYVKGKIASRGCEALHL